MRTSDKLGGTGTEAEAIAVLTEALELSKREIITHTHEGVPRLIIPDNETFRVESLEKDLPRPLHLSGNVQLQSTDSFIAYVRKYKGDREAAIYCDAETATVTAVFDHFSASQTGRAAFRAHLRMPSDPRFLAWLEKNNKWQDQETFAEFLEDHSPFIAIPDAPTLIDLITDLRVNKQVNMQSTKTLRNGNLSLVWDEQTTESREVPTRFTLKLPVYKTSRTGYEVTARLRYRFQDRQLKWLFVIDQLEDLKRLAWQSETMKLSDLSDIVPIWEGVAP